MSRPAAASLERRCLARRLLLRGLFLQSALGFGLLVSAVAAAQDDPSTAGHRIADTTFVDSVDVDIVNVEVFVTDKKGNPIRGLTRDDFRILEGGEEREITNFFAADEVREAPPDAAASDDEAPAPAAETDSTHLDLPPATVEANPAQQLQLVLFVDNRNIRPGSRNRVIRAVEESLLEQLQPTDRVTLVDYDGSVEVHTLPSSDPEEISAGLERLVEGSSYGQMVQLQRASVLRQMTQGAGTLEELRDEIEVLAQQQFDETRATIQALSQFAAVLSGLEGRKALIYVSDGLSIHPGEVLFRALGRLAGGREGSINAEARQYNLARYFEDLGKQANAGRVTFYTILASGPSSPTITPAEIPAFVNFSDTVNLGRAWDETFATMEHANHRASMEILAETTGGRSTTSTFNFDGALDDLKQDLRSYYSLGFPAAAGAETDDHRIRVEVSNPKWRVRHRETYRRLGPDEKMASVTRSALMLRQAENPLGVQVQFAPAQKHDRKQWLVPILVQFPIDRLTLIPGDSVHQGQVTIYVGSQADDGDQSPVQKLPAPIRIPDDKLEMALGQVAGYRMALVMRPGEHQIAVTVRDELAGVTSATVTSYTPDTSASD